ncbi:MAG: Crp/Fnr family transcriptional regulator [Bacteroidota bacterium]
MHPFRTYINQYAALSQSDWEQIAACLTERSYSKGAILLEEGKICRKLYFLESGLMHYYVNRDGREVTKYFTEPPYCFTSQRSLTKDLPAGESIQAITDSRVWEMSKSDAFRLLDELPSWNTFVRTLIQEVQYYTEVILEDLQNKTAEERYAEMITERNTLLEQVPLKYLASYLGIAPQSLSRIRKRFYERKRKLSL